MTRDVVGELIADGRTSEVYRYGSDAAVKLLKPSTPPDWARHEADYTEVARGIGVPTPEVLGLVDIDGRPGIVFRLLLGPSMWQRMLDRPGDVESLVGELVGLQRAIHTADLPDGLPSLTDRMRSKLDAATELDDDDRIAALALLDTMPAGGSVLHGDLHPGNVLLADEGPVVLDWFDAAVGHPTADVTRSRLLVCPTGATDLAHLPGAPAGLIERVAATFDAAVGPTLDLDPELTTAWTRLNAASRLAEGTDSATADLRRVWLAG
ncbi:MAG: phosphotransferase [Actinomycetota bacterium]